MTVAMDVRDVTEMPEVMPYVLLCMLEVVVGVLRLLEVSEVPEVMRSVLLCTLEVVEAMRSVTASCILPTAETSYN